MSKRKLIDDIITMLLDGWKIKLNHGLRGPYLKLVNGGYANYDGKYISQNWKTGYLKED